MTFVTPRGDSCPALWNSPLLASFLRYPHPPGNGFAVGQFLQVPYARPGAVAVQDDRQPVSHEYGRELPPSLDKLAKGNGPLSITARRGRRTSSLRCLCRRGIPPSKSGGHRRILHRRELLHAADFASRKWTRASGRATVRLLEASPFRSLGSLRYRSGTPERRTAWEPPPRFAECLA